MMFKYVICCSFEQVAVNFDSWISCHILVLQCWKQAEVSIFAIFVTEFINCCFERNQLDVLAILT